MTAICNCCAGIGIETPETVANRAGLPTVGYRSGTWATFKASMLAQLGGTTAHGLRTRDDDDWTIAFLDACAVVGDILTFYDERIANENYLRTATELVSLAQLSALIGYRPSPGCAASVFLAFRLNDPPPSVPPSPLAQLSSALGAIVPSGSKTQSVPGPGQVPQVFETSDDLDARWVHNALAPLLAVAYTAGNTSPPSLFVPNGGSGRNVGDTLIITSATAAPAKHVVTAIAVDPATKVAQLSLDGYVQATTSGTPAVLTAATGYGAASFTPAADTFSDALVQTLVGGKSWDRDRLLTLIKRETWVVDSFEASVNQQTTSVPAGTDIAAFTAKSAALYGHNAPVWITLPDSLTGPGTYYSDDWDTDTTLGSYSLSGYSTLGVVDLDSVYPSAVIGATVIFVDGSTQISATIAASSVVTRTGYASAGRVTSLALTNVSGGSLGDLTVRTTAVSVQDVAVPLAPVPIFAPGQYVGGQSVLLNRCTLQLPVGRTVAVSGVRADRAGVTSTELALVNAVTIEGGYTLIAFAEPLDGWYVPETVTINANVVEATNGETVPTEVLGSGDAGEAFQQFKLKQLPLTWIPDPNPTGIAAALTVRVNGITWNRVPYLYGAQPTDRSYMLATDVNGNLLVSGGDGTTGARFPSGTENVTADYRRGIGTAALVDAGTISMLVTRTPGVRDVTNPLPSNGAADPDTVADARVNAPVSVLTLGRIVTLDDYANFTRASAGVAKARVDLTWSGPVQVVLITVAGPAGAQLVSGSDQATDLLAAITNAADGSYPVLLDTYRPRTFIVAAAVAVDPAYETAVVYAAIQATLSARFSFANRDFAQPVFASEIYGAIQPVAGVIAVQLTAFCYTEAATPTVEDVLTAQPASVAGNVSVGAELLTLDIIPATLTGLS